MRMVGAPTVVVMAEAASAADGTAVAHVTVEAMAA